MKDIHINVFQNKEDTKVAPLETSWENIVTFFTSPHEVTEDKFQVSLFNFVKYKELSEIPDYSENWIMDKVTNKSYVRRKQVNVIENDCLVIDYDDTSSLDEVKKKFEEYEYIYYTSYRHLHDDKTEKFRFIIPFSTPIPSWRKKDDNGYVVDEGEWYQVIESLKKITGPCDPKSFDPNTIYNTASCPQSRNKLSQSEYHKGKLLDWTQLEKTKVKENKPTGNVITHNPNPNIESEFLDPDFMIQTKQGPIKLIDVTGKIDGVLCPNPNHNDKNGTEFVRKVEDTGNIFVYCKKCEKKFYMKRGDSLDYNEKILKNNQQYDNYDELLDDLFIHSDEKKVYEDSSDRSNVLKQLKDIKNIIDEDVGYTRNSIHPVTIDIPTRKYKSHIIYMPEGAGKSRLVVDMANSGENIIFGCKSWEQVESKYLEYKRLGLQLGFNVKVIRSKEAKARLRFNTKLVRGEQKHPFGGTEILDEESIQEFINNNPDLSPEFIRLSWNFFSSDKFSFETIPYPEYEEIGSTYDDDGFTPFVDSNTHIVLTTFEQLRIHRLKNTYIPRNWIVWFDDPDIMDVVDIEPYDMDKWNELPDEDKERKTRDINGKTYFSRNPYQSLGYSLKQHKCIYTTTEIITRQGIEVMMKKRREQFIVHDKMNNISGGEITILGTEIVRKRYDGIIPLLVRRLTKKNYPTVLIADGLSSEINHSNNKGRNDLNQINLLVELSIPHPNQIRTICDALSLTIKSNRTEITRSIILDRLHQAVGRNSGYRSKGYQSIVLVDKNVHKNVIENTRYKIDSENSVVIDRTKTMSRKDTRISENASSMVQEIEYLINNLNEYISDNRKIKPDINFVMKSIEDTHKKTSYFIRLIVSLSELSGVEITEGFTEPTTTSLIQKKYWDLIKWIINTHIPKDQVDNVNKQIRKTISEFS